MSLQKQKRKFKYRAHLSVGAMAAESDKKFLEYCFIQTGDYDAIQDFNSPKSILLGRTGTGKSAVILKVKDSHKNVITVDPQSLALNYISNSDVLQFFTKLGVKLDIFYRLLWQHVICIELLQHHFKIKGEGEVSKFKDWISGLVKKDKSSQIAAEYLEKWNSKFWLEREERIKEITETLEQKIMAGAELEKFGLKVHGSLAEGISQEVKSEIVRNAQKVVNEIQIQHLSHLIDVLANEIFSDDKKKIFITVDSLDDDWVEDELRYKLIRALIEAVKKFRRIQNVKIIVALRTDLLERVYRYTRDSGFQEEKYEDLNLRINWKQHQIKDILDERINFLFKDQYTDGRISFYDIFPNNVRPGQATFDFIVQRTLMRPRDAIAFVNIVLEKAEGSDEITGKMILDVEKVYSERRLDAILQEWFSEYPKLKKCIFLLKNKPANFSPNEVTDAELDEMIISLTSGPKTNDILEELVRSQMENGIDYSSLRNTIFSLFFKVGFIGCKESPTHPYIYSYNAGITTPHFGSNCKIQIHQMFWWSFGNSKLKGAALG